MDPPVFPPQEQFLGPAGCWWRWCNSKLYCCSHCYCPAATRAQRDLNQSHTERAERGKEQLEDGEKEGWMITVRALAGAQGRGQLCMQKAKTKLSTRKKALLTLCYPGNHSLIYHEYFNIICCTKQIKLPREKKNEAMIFYAKNTAKPNSWVLIIRPKAPIGHPARKEQKGGGERGQVGSERCREKTITTQQKPVMHRTVSNTVND